MCSNSHCSIKRSIEGSFKNNYVAAIIRRIETEDVTAFRACFSRTSFCHFWTKSFNQWMRSRVHGTLALKNCRIYQILNLWLHGLIYKESHPALLLSLSPFLKLYPLLILILLTDIERMTSTCTSQN